MDNTSLWNIKGKKGDLRNLKVDYLDIQIHQKESPDF